MTPAMGRGETRNHRTVDSFCQARKSCLTLYVDIGKAYQTQSETSGGGSLVWKRHWRTSLRSFGQVRGFGLAHTLAAWVREGLGNACPQSTPNTCIFLQGRFLEAWFSRVHADPFLVKGRHTIKKVWGASAGALKP